MSKIINIFPRILGRIITLLIPGLYFQWIYRGKREKISWDGRKACITLSFDCDYTEDIKALPSLLEILRQYSFRASFACVGVFIERYPKEHRAILNDNHEILNHTHTHPNNEELNADQKFNELSASQQKDEIKRCDTVLKNILGYSPIGFRTPHFGNLHTASVYNTLKELGYRYSSSISAAKSRSSGLPFLRDGIMEFPVSACPRHPFGVFDTWHSLLRGNKKHIKEGEFYALFKKLIDFAIEKNLYINVYFDPQDIINVKEFKQMMDYIENKKNDIWVAPYKDILNMYV